MWLQSERRRLERKMSNGIVSGNGRVDKDGLQTRAQPEFAFQSYTAPPASLVFLDKDFWRQCKKY
jgi:hypothetical protein